MFKHYLNPVEWWDDLAYHRVAEPVTPVALLESLPDDAAAIWLASPPFPPSIRQGWRKWCDAYHGSYARLIDETLASIEPPDVNRHWRRMWHLIEGTSTRRCTAVYIDVESAIQFRLVPHEGGWRVYTAFRTTEKNARMVTVVPREANYVRARTNIFRRRARHARNKAAKVSAAWNAS